MKIVYVAGPYRGANAWEIEKNIRAAENLAYTVAVFGGMPLIPHANTRFFHGTLTDQFWLDGTRELVRRCDALITVNPWEQSSGTVAEVALARECGIPIFHDVYELAPWLRGETNDPKAPKHCNACKHALCCNDRIELIESYRATQRPGFDSVGKLQEMRNQHEAFRSLANSCETYERETNDPK